MRSCAEKVALVTGASSGIGKSTVRSLLDAGATVYGAGRRVDKLNECEKMGARVVPMDVTDEASVKEGVRTILDSEKRIDILVNNAGYGSYGALEDVPIEEAQRQFAVNIFGLARLTRLVLPKMRENHYGKIVNISSMGGKVYTPFGGWYHATKHALEGLSDCLRLEVTPFGVDVIVVEPGGIKTDWGVIAAKNLRERSSGGAYAARAIKTADTMHEMYTSNRLSSPDVIARVILKAVTARRPKTRYVAGYMAGLSLFLRRWLSDRMFDRIINSQM